MFLLRESSFLLDLPDEHCHHYVDPQARDRLDILKSKLRTKFPVSVMILCVYVGVPTQWNEFHSNSTQLATLFEHHTIYLKGSLAIRVYLLFYVMFITEEYKSFYVRSYAHKFGGWGWWVLDVYCGLQSTCNSTNANMKTIIQLLIYGQYSSYCQ